jgi:hypothetical protein
MKARPLILGTLLAAVVGGAGVQVWRATNPVNGTEAETAPGVAVNVKPKVAGLPQGGAPRQSAKTAAEARIEERRATGGSSHASTTLPPANLPLVRNTQPITEQELRLRAAAVEQEANHDLKHLMGLLDLTETQQDRIFDSLVRHAPGWHPAMQTVGVAVPVDAAAKIPDASSTGPATAPTATGTESTPGNRNDVLDAIAAELTPDQQMELANAELERQEWWEEIIPKLLPNDDIPGLPGDIGTAVAAAPPPADDKTAEEPAVLAE